jgi:hypothetical protein
MVIEIYGKTVYGFAQMDSCSAVSFKVIST